MSNLAASKETLNLEADEALLRERLSEQLRQHREKQHLGVYEAAGLFCKSYDTYHRWETNGKGLTNIYDILNVFREFRFSASEVLETLGLPPLGPDDVEELVSDMAIQKIIKEEGLCSYMRKNCNGMPDSTVESLLDILFSEWLKRRHGKG